MSTHLTDAGRALLLKGEPFGPLHNGILRIDAIAVKCEGNGFLRFVGYYARQPVFETEARFLAEGDRMTFGPIQCDFEFDVSEG